MAFFLSISFFLIVEDQDMQGFQKKKALPSMAEKANQMTKGHWTPEEDQFLVRMVSQFGLKKWSLISQMFVFRNGKQCRERWFNHLRPDIKKDAWTEEEEKELIKAHEIVGNGWAEIAKRIPGRTDNSVKNHWNAAKRRMKTKIKSLQTEESGPNMSQCSPLENYIMTKILDTERRNERTENSNSGAPFSHLEGENESHDNRVGETINQDYGSFFNGDDEDDMEISCLLQCPTSGSTNWD